MAIKYLDEKRDVNSRDWDEAVKWFSHMDNFISKAYKDKNTKLQWLADWFGPRLYDVRNELEYAIEADELLSKEDKQSLIAEIQSTKSGW